MFRLTLTFVFFVSSLFSAYRCSAHADDSNRLTQADEYFEATLFDEAILLYQLILQDSSLFSSDQLSKEYVKIRFAQALFAEKKYLDVQTVLKEELQTPRLNKIRLYLLALSYKSLDKPKEAMTSLTHYFKSNKEPKHPLDDEASLELGLLLFNLHQIDESKPYFELLNEKRKNDDLQFLARIYLARIAFEENKIKESEQLLNQLESVVPEDHLLAFELSYWQGKVYYEQADFRKAIHYFEKSIPRKRQDQADWYVDSVYHLSLSWLALGNTNGISSEEQKQAFSKAENLLKQIVDKSDKALSESIYLALAETYLSAFKKFGNTADYEKANQILSRNDIIFSLEGRSESLLLKAQSETSYDKRNDFFKLLTDDMYQETNTYPYGWYYRALNDFQQGEELMKLNRPEEANRLFEQAAYSFRRAFQLLETSDPTLLVSAAKFQTQTLLNLQSVDGNLKAFHVLNQLSKNYAKEIQNLPDPGEIYYLLGYTASLLATKADEFKDAAKKNLGICSFEYIHSAFNSDALYLLGCFLYNSKEYAEAEHTFLKLTKKPKNNHTGNAYFWLARCLTRQQKNPQEIALYRTKVFEEYPESPFAPEAYFGLYSYKNYILGDRQSMKHLMGFKGKYPNSPLLINAIYLIGMDAKRDRSASEGKSVKKKNLKDAIEAFILAENTFDLFMEKGTIPADNLNYYINLRYLCTMERALANLAIADGSQGAKRRIFLEYAEEVLQNLFNEFGQNNHALTQRLVKQEPYPRILEECTYWLSQVHIKNQNYDAAEKKLLEMLNHYKTANVTRGYFLSRAFYDLGLISMQKKEPQKAIHYYQFSEDAAKGKLISSDQKIDLWIQQSLCYRDLDELDKAMLLLSRAINDEAISSLRIKAMFLRAELYSVQGRQELARKQLESASKNSGEWAQKAKQKLNEEYGYQ